MKSINHHHLTFLRFNSISFPLLRFGQISHPYVVCTRNRNRIWGTSFPLRSNPDSFRDLSTNDEVIGKSKVNFITNIIQEDIDSNWNGGRVITRFPPEPNGYLHLGHAKSINFNFGVAKDFNGVTNMRFDDTNPAKEDMEYVNAILDDVKWLVTGEINPDIPPWNKNIRHASDYFPIIYKSAEYLIQNGLAYVDNLSPDEMREYRGTLSEPGKNSPYRNRSVEENLQLFHDMKSGKFADGQCVVRAKIDMSSPNMNLRDPTLYRIKSESHPITGDEWCIYPMYDFAHAISDAVEGITHSICTLEFENHRPLYDWIIDNLQPSGLLPYAEQKWRPKQIEFSRLNLQYTVLSKRKLIQLVNEKHVTGWNDPRMPTICGLRRRGYPASSIKLFCDRIGISKAENNIDLTVLEDCAREVLDVEAARIFALTKPLKVTISNWSDNAEDDKIEIFNVDNHPKKTEFGKRDLYFSSSLYIDEEDFFDTGIEQTISPPKGFKRLLLGGTVRLKNAYVIKCDQVVRDENTGKVIELLCSYDQVSRAGAPTADGKKPKGIIQWLSRSHCVPIELSLYDRLFISPSPGKDSDNFLDDINPNSLVTIHNALVESSVIGSSIGTTFQFERLGYFCLDSINGLSSNGGNIMSLQPLMKFNRVVTLKDTWSTTNTSAVTNKTTANSTLKKRA
eukprot:gene4399-6222_t